MEVVISVGVSVIMILLLIALASVIPIINDKENRADLFHFKNLFLENFHLNNAASFIGYTVFDESKFFIIFYVFSLIVYYLEHYWMTEDKTRGKLVEIGQWIVFAVGIIGQIICAYTIISNNGGTV